MEHDQIIKQLKSQQLILPNGNISCWLSRKIDASLSQQIYEQTQFLNPDEPLDIRVRSLLLGLSNKPVCKICGTPTKFQRSKGNFATYCSVRCQGKDPDVLDKRKNTNLTRYGFECKLATFDPQQRALNAVPKSKSSIRYTKQQIGEMFQSVLHSIHTRYDIDRWIKSYPGMRESIDAIDGYKLINEKLFSLILPHTCNQCGANTSFNSKTRQFYEFCVTHTPKRASSKQSNHLIKARQSIEQSGLVVVSEPTSINEGNFVVQCSQGHTFDRRMNNGRISDDHSKSCEMCFPKTTSHPEHEIAEWIESLGFSVVKQHPIEKNGRGVTKVDIYIPEKQLAIEFDGVMFHSFGKSKYSMFDNADVENKNCHLIKTQVCERQGIDLLHIFSNEWELEKMKWKSVIQGKLGINERIFARKCEVIEVSSKQAEEFFERCHLQGNARAATIFALRYETEIVAMMSFSKCRYSNKADYEIIRFASKLNTNVVGGFSKLLSAFRKSHQGKILSYANKRWSKGNVYVKNGFVIESHSPPNYFYFHESNPNKLMSRVQFQRHKLEGQGTERDIMFANGYRRIWDCGNIVCINN